MAAPSFASVVSPRGGTVHASFHLSIAISLNLPSNHKPQLDGLRAVAVCLVIWAHTMAPTRIGTADFGAIGVTMFFVLSGFLITGILLAARTKGEEERASKAAILGRFYVRRFLRIFPLYYGVLAGLWLVAEPHARNYLPWLLSYQTNTLLASRPVDLGIVTLYWSLAVEEQYYLAWPLIVLFAKRSRLPIVLAAMVGMSVLWRGIATARGLPQNTALFATWACLDGLAIGSALARLEPSAREKLARIALRVGLVLLAFRAALALAHRADVIQAALYMLPWALVSVWLVERAYLGRLPRILGSQVLASIGVVSYGMYVYHRVVTVYVYNALIMQFRGHGMFAGPRALVGVTILTFAVATVSWLLYERPINNLKRFVPYVRRQRAAETVATGA